MQRKAYRSLAFVMGWLLYQNKQKGSMLFVVFCLRTVWKALTVVLYTELFFLQRYAIEVPVQTFALRLFASFTSN